MVIKSQYILDILNLLLDSSESQHILGQIPFLNDVSYNYTGVGVFVEFKPLGVINKEFLSKEKKIIDGVTIESDELEYGAMGLIFFDDNGVVNTLEIVAFGDYYPKKDLVNYTVRQEWMGSSEKCIENKNPQTF